MATATTIDIASLSREALKIALAWYHASPDGRARMESVLRLAQRRERASAAAQARFDQVLQESRPGVPWTEVRSRLEKAIAGPAEMP